MSFQRTLKINQAKRAAGDLSSEIAIAISSEEPYQRWFGIEILSHDSAAVDLSRLADGRHPLLLNHCTDDQIGVITSVSLDADRVLRGSAKFSQSELGKEIAQDVADGIRSLISVGYMIMEVEEVEPVDPADIGEESARPWRSLRKLTGEEFTREMRAKYGEDFYRAGLSAQRAEDDPMPTFIVTRWQPFEASVVPVPADVTVGVGRSAGVEDPPKQVAPDTKPAVIVVQSERKIMSDISKTPAELEAARTLAILNLGENYAKYISQKDIAEHIRNGRSVEQFQEFIMQKLQSSHTDTRDMNIGMNKKEVERYSLTRAIVASMSGDWSSAGLEREASEAVAKKFARTPEGFYVPNDYFQRDFNLGTSSEAGNLRATDLRTDLYVDALRNNICVARMGLRVLSGLQGNVAIPRKATAGSLGMLAEIGSATETNPTIQQATLSPKRVGAYVEVSKQALIQSAMALDSMLRDDLLMGAAVLLENQILNGVGSSNEMTGIRNTSSIGTVAAGSNGAILTWGNLVDLESACANSNAEPDQVAGYVINTRTRGKAKQVVKSTNLPFIWQDGSTPLNGYKVGVTNNLPNNLTKGTSTTICSAAIFGADWSMGVLGLFGAPDITVDPYSKADSGQVKITLNQFADFTVRQPAAFAKIEDLLSN
jgi:HK97 family phage major capsid protein